jgi:type I restriction enzyme S subunit
MELKSGYKQTEAGLIPADWNVRRVAELATYRNGKSYEDRIVENGEYFLITLDSLDIDGNLKSEHKTINHLDGSLSKDDLVMILSDVAHGNFLGLTDLIPQSHRYVLNQRVGSLQNLRGVDPRFLSEFINSRQIYFKTCGQGSSQQNLAKNDILNFLVLVPPLPEQRAIAMALNDLDALINALDKLIVKRRDLKQAAMQQLLTGKQRLPGFSEEWEVKRLEDVTSIDPENLGSDTPPEFAFNYISLEDVDLGILKGYSEQVFRTAPSRARRKVQKGDILVSTVRPNLKSHLLFTEDGQYWICSTGFSVVRANAQIAHSGYVFFQFFGDHLSRKIEALLSGSNYPAINSADVRALEIPIPSYDEQVAIAAVLSDMDAEIVALEKRRDKTKSLKQGMMQELLAGKTRLI